MVTAPQAALAGPVTLSVRDADVRTVLTTVARLGGAQLVLDDSVRGRITLELDGVEPEDAFRLIAKAKGFSLGNEAGIWLVTTQEGAGQSLYGAHIFTLNYADAETVAAAVNMALGRRNTTGDGENGRDEDAQSRLTGEAAPEAGVVYSRAVADMEARRLVVYGTDEEAREAEKIVRALDICPKQVSLEAKIIAIDNEDAKKLGVEWEWSKAPQSPEYSTTYESRRSTVQNADGSYTTVTTDVPHTTVTRQWKDGSEPVPGIISFGRNASGHPFEFYYAARLNALVTQGKAKVLSKPNITTLQGREAVINIGGEVPVPTVQTTNSTTTTSVEYREAGIILRCTPRVNEDGSITAAVHTEVSSPVYVESLKAYRFNKRSADTNVRLKDGETMVIGGLIGSEEAKSMSKVPFLGDLPILGAFFRNHSKTKSTSEVMIFLTAHVVGGNEKGAVD